MNETNSYPLPIEGLTMIEQPPWKGHYCTFRFPLRPKTRLIILFSNSSLACCRGGTQPGRAAQADAGGSEQPRGRTRAWRQRAGRRSSPLEPRRGGPYRSSSPGPDHAGSPATSTNKPITFTARLPCPSLFFCCSCALTPPSSLPRRASSPGRRCRIVRSAIG
jgi:hypothetical protein